MSEKTKSRAEYFQKYRKDAKPRNERDAYQEGMREGINLCVKFLRDKVAGCALTGFQAAKRLDTEMIGAETPEVVLRRLLVDSLRT